MCPTEYDPVSVSGPAASPRGGPSARRCGAGMRPPSLPFTTVLLAKLKSALTSLVGLRGKSGSMSKQSYVRVSRWSSN